MASPQPASKYNYMPKSPDERFEYADGEYRDKCWYVIFVIHLVGMIAAGAMYGGNLIDAMGQSSGGGSIDISGAKPIFAVLLVASIAGIACGAFWLQIMKTCEIMTLLYLYVAMEAMVTVGLYFVDATAALIGAFFLAITCIWLFCCARRHIPFAEAVMRPSAQALQEQSGVIFISYILAPVQIIWMFAWSFITLAIFYKLNPNSEYQQSSKNEVIYFFLLISLYWTAEVVKNVGHVTTSGTVASWWFQPQAPSPTMNAFKRSVTTSFGSICFGSLIVAVLKAIEAILRQAQDNAARSDNAAAMCIICIARCCLDCIRSMAEYFNVYAYTHVAVYGEDYITAAKSTWSLIKSNGFTLIINDNIIGLVLTLGILLGGLATAAVSGIFALMIVKTWWVALTVAGGFIGIIMVALVVNAMNSAVATTFVCWAEDPASMQRGRPGRFKDMNDAARERYGGDWQNPQNN